jgi:hypothetical protein
VTAEKNPIEDAVEQAIDAFVYAPIGLLFDGPARLPKLVRNGKNQVTNARMMGQFAVQMGRTEVEKRASTLDGPVVDLLRGLGVVPGVPTATPAPTATEPAAEAAVATPEPVADAGAPATTKPVKQAKQAAKAVSKAATKATKNKAAAKKATSSRTAATDAATPSADVLPISDYDSLSASQVVSRLRGLAPGQLEAIRSYEAATRGRKTILNRVQQLSKS